MTSYCRRLFLCRLTIAIILTVSRSSFLLADVLTCSSTTITISFDYEPKVLVYPGSGVYPISVTCRWLLQAKASDFTFFLRFKNPIAIGSETFNLYNGPDATSTKLFGSGGITSGTDGNYRYSTTDKVFMEFTSDTTSSPSETGFTLEIGNGKDTSGCSTPSTSQTITLSWSPYFLASPSFPSSNYPLNTNCTWTFTTSDPSATIVVRFLYQDFDRFGGRCYDNVKVYEGSTVLQAALIESQLCDEIFLSTDTRNTTGNSVTVDFYSDNVVTAKGFSALVFEIGADSNSPTITSSLITQSTSSSTTSETATDTTASTTESTAILKDYTTTTSTSSSSITESTAAPKDYTTTSTSSSSVSESTATHYTTSTSSTTESTYTSESTYASAALQSSTLLSIVTTDSTAKNLDSTTSFYVTTSILTTTYRSQISKKDEEAGTDPVLIGACVACLVALVGVVAIIAGKQLLGKASSVELAIVEAVKSYPSVDIGHTQPKFYTSNLVIDVPNK